MSQIKEYTEEALAADDRGPPCKLRVSSFRNGTLDETSGLLCFPSASSTDTIRFLQLTDFSHDLIQVSDR